MISFSSIYFNPVDACFYKLDGLFPRKMIGPDRRKAGQPYIYDAAFESINTGKFTSVLDFNITTPVINGYYPLPSVGSVLEFDRHPEFKNMTICSYNLAEGMVHVAFEDKNDSDVIKYKDSPIICILPYAGRTLTLEANLAAYNKRYGRSITVDNFRSSSKYIKIKSILEVSVLKEDTYVVFKNIPIVFKIASIGNGYHTRTFTVSTLDGVNSFSFTENSIFGQSLIALSSGVTYPNSLLQGLSNVQVFTTNRQTVLNVKINSNNRVDLFYKVKGSWYNDCMLDAFFARIILDDYNILDNPMQHFKIDAKGVQRVVMDAPKQKEIEMGRFENITDQYRVDNRERTDAGAKCNYYSSADIFNEDGSINKDKITVKGNPIMGVDYNASTTIEIKNERENKPMASKKLADTAANIFQSNKDAAQLALRLEAGKIVTNQVVKLMAPKLPFWAQGYAQTPLGKVAIANAAAFGIKHYSQNPKHHAMADILIQSAGVEMIKSFNIEKLIEDVFNSAKLPDGFDLDAYVAAASEITEVE